MNPFSLFDLKPRAIVKSDILVVVGETTESYLTRVLGRPMVPVDGALSQEVLGDLADRFLERTGVRVTCREDAPLHVVFEPTMKGLEMRPLHEVDAAEAESAAKVAHYRKQEEEKMAAKAVDQEPTEKAQ